MGQINIYDTGYIKPTNEGTQASAINMAGTAIALKTAEFVPQLKRNISSQPALSSNEPAEVNLGSLENMQFKLKCVLNNTNTDDMAVVAQLLDIIATNGYKLMWYDYSTSGENNNGQLIYNITLNSKFGHVLTDEEKTAFGISDNFYHLHVLFTDIQENQLPKNLIRYTLSGIVLPVETSILT